MRRMTKKMTAFFLALFMVVTLCAPASTSAMAAESAGEVSIQSYTPMGDSVSTGYGPLISENRLTPFLFKTGEGAYPRLVKDQLGITEENYHPLTSVQLSTVDLYYILGGDMTEEQRARSLGYHGSDYLDMMDEFHAGKGREYVENSDLITVAVGNIDLSVYPIRENQVTSAEDLPKLIAAIERGKNDVKNYLPQILQRIRSFNPDAKVLLLSQYDPLTKVLPAENDPASLMYKQLLAGTTLEINAYMAQWLQENPGVADYLDITGVSEYIDEMYTNTPDATAFMYACMKHENHPGAIGHQWLRDQIMSAVGASFPEKKEKTDQTKSYVAFSSDVHTSDNELSLKRLNQWANQVSEQLDGAVFDYMCFAGDMAQYDYWGYTGGDPHTTVYWNKFARLVDTVDHNPVIGKGIYTTGDHDFDYAGNWRRIPDHLKTKAPYNYMTQFGEAANEKHYQIYCFGANSYYEEPETENTDDNEEPESEDTGDNEGSESEDTGDNEEAESENISDIQEFKTEDIEALSEYMKNCDQTKPVFILSHYPIHSYDDRSTGNASQLVDVLNDYPNAVFLWGHNHTESDSHYNKVYTGDELVGMPIKFVYASAGCMSDSDYSEGSGNIQSKGLVARMNGSNIIRMTYFDENGTIVSDYDVNITTATSEAHKPDVCYAGGEHSLTKTEAVAASCIASGTEEYWTCSKCNKLYGDEAAGTEIEAPVVTEKDPANHVGESEARDAKAATCTEDGYTGDSYCKACNGLLSGGSVIPATGHAYDDGVVTKEASCTESGEKTYTCTSCSATRTEGIEMLSHKLTYHEAVEATETATGNLAYYVCDSCGKYFADAEAAVEISAESVVIPELEHVHQITVMAGQAAGCAEDGFEDCYSCLSCGKLFADQAGEVEIEAALVIPATGHSYDNGVITENPTCTEKGTKTYTCENCGATETESLEAVGHDYSSVKVKPATTAASGYTKVSCNVCGDVKSKVSIAKISGMKLNYKTCVYSGNYKKPGLVVTDVNGKVIASSNYKVTRMHNKNVGTATVKVVFDGRQYDGSLSATFKICPMKTSITSVSALTKGMKLKWTKVTKQISGYQIEISRSKSFSNAKRYKVSSYQTTSKEIKSLSAKKKYYVRIRVYKTVDGKNYYSAWSADNSVTTK